MLTKCEQELAESLPRQKPLFSTCSTLLHLCGQTGPKTASVKDPSVIDALLAIGLWLEENDKIVAGPLNDKDFLQLLPSLFFLPANCPFEELRYPAQVLTGSILHAHPHDRVRLTLLPSTLEHCFYEALCASALAWLEKELITAHERSSSPHACGSAGSSHSHEHEGHSHSLARSAFATTAAISALQPHLFPYDSAMTTEKDGKLWEEFPRTYLSTWRLLDSSFFLCSERAVR